MIHCVSIGDSYHLFLYGSLVCYTKWQTAIIVIILPGILLFPIGYDLSLRMLRKGYLRSTTFIISTACPYIALILYIWNNRSMKRDSENEDSLFSRRSSEVDFARRVFESEEELFAECKKSFSWNTIQFYRTIIVNIFTIFFANPFYRLLFLSPVLFAFYLHDRYRQPYKHFILNNIQALSSGCLLLVLSCNVVAAFSFNADISTVDGISTVTSMSSIFELVLYAVVPLYYPLWTVWGIISSKVRGKSD